ncbi:HAAS domain-containing protein [Jeotgalibacillus proteolyticus]|uniref:HAAS transmembrane region domain-containing protein n=1 Tax=Jeotgalibacillus proteolyticus TaxID=2082395 RepID=A0A2S5G8R4_9BACL|nr:hypothetical protein [Jeotgalibacillus proteolyticus]PPA69392.1 hypothetical protein C4B60_16515 [Jeotgalibacillus proteolyticus]
MDNLSKESRRFLDDLRLYLFSSGKNEAEIGEIAEELEVHFAEAEKNGKPIEQIVGESPKEYMEMISKEMKVDTKAWLKYIPLIIFGAISFSVIAQLVDDLRLNFSYVFLGGTVVISIIFILLVFGVFKYTASRQVSKTKELLMIMIPSFLNIALFGALIFWDMFYTLPGIQLGVTASIITGGIVLLFLIGFSFWAKTAILPVILAALHIPELLLRLTSLEVSARLIIGMIITYIVIGLYLYYTFKKLKKEETASA